MPAKPLLPYVIAAEKAFAPHFGATVARTYISVTLSICEPKNVASAPPITPPSISFSVEAKVKVFGPLSTNSSSELFGSDVV